MLTTYSDLGSVLSALFLEHIIENQYQFFLKCVVEFPNDTDSGDFFKQYQVLIYLIYKYRLFRIYMALCVSFGSLYLLRNRPILFFKCVITTYLKFLIRKLPICVISEFGSDVGFGSSDRVFFLPLSLLCKFFVESQTLCISQQCLRLISLYFEV